MTKEVLKLALEALETCGDDEWHTDDDFGMMQTYDADKVNQAITAIKEALAQSAQEPVAWSWVPSEDWGTYFTEDASKAAVMRERGLEVRPLYTTPQPRPWIELTGELTRNELLELANTFYTGGFTEREIAFARVVLAKSKEKNT